MADGQGGHIELHVLRDIGRKHLDLQLAQHVVEHAAEVPDPVGNANQMDGNGKSDLLVGPDLIQIEVQDLGGADGVPLNFPDERLDRRTPVHHHVEHRGSGAHADQHLAQSGGFDRQGFRGPVVAIDDARDLALAPKAAGSALAGGVPGSGLEVCLLGHLYSEKVLESPAVSRPSPEPLTTANWKLPTSQTTNGPTGRY